MKKLISLSKVAGGLLSVLAAAAVLAAAFVIAKDGKTSARVKPSVEIPGPSAPGAFAVADRAAGRTGGTASAASSDSVTASIEIPRVAPIIFAGDVRHLPIVPQRGVDRPELGEPVGAKQFLPEAQFP